MTGSFTSKCRPKQGQAGGGKQGPEDIEGVTVAGRGFGKGEDSEVQGENDWGEKKRIFSEKGLAVLPLVEKLQ